ncbi:metallophosphoesterase [Paenibacillus sp. HB172176]|uniref:metallophosphoesterase n=1 Tax=Paenibacillus sp. HB172176 TaxID=2493690 RepID=UPI00143B2B6C|nr:metallophosphoesterase [Paenibacillus sp. HB172176]
MLVISDIHGYKEGLLSLLRMAGYNPASDQLVLLGDYIEADKPATWGILDTIMKLVRNGALALPGNHELKLVGMLRKRGARGERLRRYIRWINKLPPYYINGSYLFVHAGIRPGVPLKNQSLRDLTEIRESFYSQTLPDLEEDLQLEPSRRTPYGDMRVIFGHTPSFKLGAPPGTIWKHSRLVSIDTGAKHGCRLTLLDLTGGVAYSCASKPGYRASDYRADSVRHMQL